MTKPIENPAAEVSKGPKPATYKIKVDKLDLETGNPTVTGRELLTLAGKTPPERYQLHQRTKGGRLEEVTLDGTVDLREPGVERFITLPLDQTEGEAAQPRRDFALLEPDVAALDAFGLRWEAVSEGGVARVVIRNYPVPAGYNLAQADICLRLDPGYPTTQIDMVYVFPHLARADGYPIRALVSDIFEGKTWQGWSRHRTADNPWRPDIDDIGTHLRLVDFWFAAELKKAA